MAELAISRLASRVLAPDIDAAWAAAPVLEQATRGLPAALAPLVDRILAAAGLDEDAAIAIPRLDLRLPFHAEPGRLADAWAAAIAAAVGERLRQVPGDRDPDVPQTVFADAWEAQAALLTATAAGRPAPWWAEALVPGGADAARLIGEWIEREPARAAAQLLELLVESPALAALLGAAAARRLAGRLLQRLAKTQRATAEALDGADAPWAAAWLAQVFARVPSSLASRIAALPESQRPLFALASLMIHAPAASAAFARPSSRQGGIEQALALLARAPRDLPAQEGPAPKARDAATKPADPADAAGPAAEAAKAVEAEGVQVMNAGLLLLLRPLEALGIVDETSAAELPGLMLAIGLCALQRVTSPLAPAARRAMLERDRLLLAAFAGAPADDAPLEGQSAPAEAARWLDAAMAAAPQGVAFAPGALRSGFGNLNPFETEEAERLGQLLLRPGRLALTPWSAEVLWPLDTADLALRRAGWDIDPGWLPWIGRVVRFRYGGVGGA